jgi:hypothetical protein
MHWLPWWAYPAGCCFLVGGACGWQLGYLHRGLVEWGRRAGRLLAWQRRYRARGPLVSAYRELWRGSEHLAGAFIESAPWITAGATPSQRADLCAVSVATEEAARHL